MEKWFCHMFAYGNRPLWESFWHVTCWVMMLCPIFRNPTCGLVMVSMFFLDVESYWLVQHVIAAVRFRRCFWCPELMQQCEVDFWGVWINHWIILDMEKHEKTRHVKMSRCKDVDLQSAVSRGDCPTMSSSGEFLRSGQGSCSVYCARKIKPCLIHKRPRDLPIAYWLVVWNMFFFLHILGIWDQ